MPPTSHEIDKQAADWVAKRDLGMLSPEEAAAFESWLAADMRHLGAYGRAEATLARLERLNGLALENADKPAAPAWRRRGVILTGTVAASLAAIAVAIKFRPAFSGQVHEEIFSTSIGQMREVVLADGSVVSLNTNSEIAVHYTAEARNISLLRGEALFDVAKNKSRPFIVTAGDTRVRAVGTSFTVSMLPQKPIKVLVKEGVVELQRSSLPEAIPIRASANIQALAPPGAPIFTVAMPEERLARNLAWQRGRIALDNQSLESAADEFARYSEVRIVVDQGVSGRTVTGLFASNDPVGFARAVAAALRLQVEMDGNEVRIFDGQNKNP